MRLKLIFPYSSGLLLEPEHANAAMPNESSPHSENRIRMTSHSSTINKEALQELQITVADQSNAVLSRDGTIESQDMIEDKVESKAEQEHDKDVDEEAISEVENHYEARRMSESSTGEAIKKRLGSRKKTKYRNQDKYRSRHPSSGGESSTDLHHSIKKVPAKTQRLSLLAPTRYRSRTKSEPPEEQVCDDSSRIKFCSHDDENLEDYDEFDLLAEMKVPKRRTTSGSGPGYLRSMSDVVVPQIATTTTGSMSASEEDGLTTKQRMVLAAKHRRHLHGKRKNYTSITDELEMMIATSPPPCLDLMSESVSPVVPKFEIEKEYLNDAEEVDYDMMETIIHKRLRRDSTNLQASVEDWENKSILGSRCPSPAIQRQEAVQSFEPDSISMDADDVDGDGKLVIRVVRKETTPMKEIKVQNQETSGAGIEEDHETAC